VLFRSENPIENDIRFKHIQVPLIDDFTKLINIKDSSYLTIIEAFKPQLKEIFNSIRNFYSYSSYFGFCSAAALCS
jgi:hypothetical protein